MEYILVLLIVALLNGAIAYIDGLMEGIIPLTLYAEQYMSTLAGVDLFQSLFDIVFGFGVSLIVLKFLKKGFETYVLWSDGDADEEPIAILTNFFKATMLSDVVRGLISVKRGDNGIMYFQMLSMTFKQLELQKLKLEAMKQPGKMRKYSFMLLGCFLLMYLGVLGYVVLEAFGELF